MPDDNLGRGASRAVSVTRHGGDACRNASVGKLARRTAPLTIYCAARAQRVGQCSSPRGAGVAGLHLIPLLQKLGEESVPGLVGLRRVCWSGRDNERCGVVRKVWSRWSRLRSSLVERDREGSGLVAGRVVVTLAGPWACVGTSWVPSIVSGGGTLGGCHRRPIGRGPRLSQCRGVYSYGKVFEMFVAGLFQWVRSCKNAIIGSPARLQGRDYHSCEPVCVEGRDAILRQSGR